MKILSAALTAIVAAAVAALAYGWLAGGLLHAPAILAAATGLVAGMAAWITTPASEPRKLNAWDWAMLSIFSLVSLRAFVWLIYSAGDNLLILSPNNLGDLSLHIGLVRYLASGVPFWPDSLILTGVPLTYPIGADLVNAIGEVLGVDTFRGLIVAGLIGSALTAGALWMWGRAFAIAAFLFNGGLAGFVFFRTFATDDFQTELVWKSLFLSMFVTQRGLLIAIPAGVLLLCAWRDRYFRGKPSVPQWVEWLLYAAMPLFNIHAFLYLSLILLGLFLFRPGQRFSVFRLVAAAVIPASILVALITGFFSATSAMRWLPGWMMETEGWRVYWHDFGISLPLVIILCVLVARQKDAEARYFAWSSALVFLLGSLVVFAVWPWDNLKLVIWSWLAVAPYLWTNLLARVHWLGRSALCFVLFFSGAISLVGGLDTRHGYFLARKSELAAWKMATIDLPASTRFAITPDYNHPLILLGRKVVCGYDGHLWSHGLPYEEKYAMLKAALAGQTAWEQANPLLQADWLARRTFDPITAESLPTPDPASQGMLYDLTPYLKPDRDNQSSQPQPPRSVGLPW